MAVTHGGNIFEIAREHGWDWREVTDFSASINPLGPAPGVAPAICKAIDRIAHYPEREPSILRHSLAKLWEVDESQILLGNGATELLHFFARITHHENVTLSLPAFSEFHRAYPEAAPSADGLLVLTQPVNPTGAVLETEILERHLFGTRRPVLIDESFLDFTGLPSAACFLDRRPHLYILRSLTKFYALPGLRIGALLASAGTIAEWRRHREPWQVNVLAEAAALAAITDSAHAFRSREYVNTERTWLSEELASLRGVHVEPSHANYLFARLDYPAAGLYQHFLEARMLIRNCVGTPGIEGEAVRIAVRTRAENQRLMARWKDYPWAA